MHIVKDTSKKTKRCFLFAAYYVDNKVDAADQYHLRKLAELGDVHYFVDSPYFSSQQADKIRPYVRTLLWEKHGEYDFGSWKRLIEQIGEFPLSRYDEIYLVNNSSYLVNDLSPILNDFGSSDADFFALGLLDENYRGQNLHYEDYLIRFSAYHDNALFPSFFLGFKTQLFNSDFIQEFFASVQPETDRLTVCYKYERGLTRTLLRHRVKFKLFEEFVYKYSFVYTREIFSLVKRGFPYLKRKVLDQQYYEFDLESYRMRGLLKSIAPDAAQPLRVDFFESKGLSDLTTIELFQDYLFDNEWYLETYPDVKAAAVNPLEHFLRFGYREDRAPSPWFSLKNFVWNYPKVEPIELDRFIARLNDEFLLEFDARFYAEQSGISGSLQELMVDYLKNGWQKNFLPNRNADFDPVARPVNPACGSLMNPYFAPRTVNSSDASYLAKQKRLAQKHIGSKKLIIYFNVAKDLIGGGMLSINRFAKRTDELISESKSVSVSISGVPLTNNAVEHTQFEAHSPQIHFSSLVEETDPLDVVLLLPEVFAIEFEQQLTTAHRKWLYSRRSVEIVILNQNNDMMPRNDVLQQVFSSIPCTLKITTAHKSYCTERLSAHYCLPVKQLTPYLPEMPKVPFVQKERIIMVSADRIERARDGLDRESVLENLKSALPGYQFVTVQNMSLEFYLELASHAMFSLTFGEGMDGYFIEPVLAGGISFAVFNSVFFDQTMKDCPTVYPDWDTLIVEMPKMIHRLEENPDEYARMADFINERLEQTYSRGISDHDLTSFLNGAVDHTPHSKLEAYRLANKAVCALQENGHRVIGRDDKINVFSSRSGIIVRHFGGSYYNELDVLFNTPHESLLVANADRSVLVDIAANFGGAALALVEANPLLRAAYLYEGADQTAMLTNENLLLSQSTVPLKMKQICLSDRYEIKTKQYYNQWANLLSPQDEPTDPLVADQCRVGEYLSAPTELECVPASVEIAAILEENPDSALILRSAHEEYTKRVLCDLAEHDLIERITTLIVTLQSSTPLAWIEEFGFTITKKISSDDNGILIISADRQIEVVSHKKFAFETQIGQI